MTQFNKIGSIAFAVVIGVILQLVFIQIESRDTPSRAAIEFTKAYFKLDKSMSEYLCKELSEEDSDLVDDYIDKMADEARELGFGFNYMRSVLHGIHTQVIEIGDSEAQIRLQAKRKRYINPVYTIIGGLFSLGETYPVDETINLKKEDGRWKVCGLIFELSS